MLCVYIPTIATITTGQNGGCCLPRTTQEDVFSSAAGGQAEIETGSETEEHLDNRAYDCIQKDLIRKILA